MLDENHSAVTCRFRPPCRPGFRLKKIKNKNKKSFLNGNQNDFNYYPFYFRTRRRRRRNLNFEMQVSILSSSSPADRFKWHQLHPSILFSSFGSVNIA